MPFIWQWGFCDILSHWLVDRANLGAQGLRTEVLSLHTAAGVMQHSVGYGPRAFVLLPCLQLTAGLLLDIRVWVIIQGVYRLYNLLLHAESLVTSMTRRL